MNIKDVNILISVATAQPPPQSLWPILVRDIWQRIIEHLDKPFDINTLLLVVPGRRDKQYKEHDLASFRWEAKKLDTQNVVEIAIRSRNEINWDNLEMIGTEGNLVVRLHKVNETPIVVLEVSLGGGQLTTTISAELQFTFLEIVANFCQSYSAVIGFISPIFDPSGIAGIVSSYEQFAGYLSVNFITMAKGWEKYGRGYHWVDYLSRQHVEKIGGLPAIRSAEPFKATVDRTGGVLVQLTPSINDIDKQALTRWRSVLLPILPPRTRVVPPSILDDELLLVESRSALEEAQLPQPVAGRNVATGPEFAPMTSAEARAWLQHAENILAGNRFGSPTEALAFVERLYKLGAKRVEILLPMRVGHNQIIASAIRIRMPDDAKKRAKLFQLIIDENIEGGFLAPEEVGLLDSDAESHAIVWD